MSNGSMKQIDTNQAITLASPYPYTLAVTMTPDGKPNAIGISWWTFTSLAPPMLLISVGGPRYSHECLKNLGEFALCFPPRTRPRAPGCAERNRGAMSINSRKPGSPRSPRNISNRP